MRRNVFPRRILACVVVATLLLPVLICVLLGVARLLAAMQDVAGAAVVDRLALAAGVLWIVDLVVLVIFAGIELVARPVSGEAAAGDADESREET